MFCSNCGAQLEDDAVFCANCGTKVEALEENITESLIETDTAITGDVSVAEEPVAEEPVAEEPIAEQPVIEEPVAEEPVAEEPIAEQPVIEEPVAEEPVAEEPAAEEPAAEESVEGDSANIEVVEGEIVGADEVIPTPNPEPVTEKEAEETSTTEIMVSNQGDASQIKYCHNCGAANSVNDAFCYSCGANMNEDAAPKKKVNAGPIIKKIALFVSIAAVIAVAVFGASKLIGGKNKSGIVYLKDGDLYEWSKKEPHELEGKVFDDVESTRCPRAELSKDEKYLYYSMKYSEIDGYDLYYKKYLNNKDEGTKIASKVKAFMVLDNNNVLFRSDGKLFISDLKNKEKIDSDVNSFWVSEDQSSIIWTKKDDDKIYYSKLNMKPEKEKLVSGMDFIVFVSDDLKTIHYINEDGESYIIKNFGDKEKISDDDLGYVGGISRDNKYYAFFCEETGSEKVDIDLIIDDDFASDANINEPVLEDYQHVETKPSFWGTRESIVTDDKYYEDYDLYMQKVERDYLRNEIADMCSLITADVYLYSCDKNEKDKIYSGPVSNYQSLDYVFQYKIYDFDNIKKIKLSELQEMSYSERVEKIDNIFRTSSKVVLNNGTSEAELNIDSDDYDISAYNYVCMDKKNDVLYASLYEKEGDEEFTLISIDCKKIDGSYTEIAKEVYSFGDTYKGKPCYFCDPDKKYESADLYVDGEKIASDVALNCYMGCYNSNCDDYLSFLCDINSKREGDLYLYDGKLKEVATDVKYSSLNEKGEVAVLTDWNSKKDHGDLKVWRNGKLYDVDEDVSNIIFF